MFAGVSVGRGMGRKQGELTLLGDGTDTGVLLRRIGVMIDDGDGLDRRCELLHFALKAKPS